MDDTIRFCPKCKHRTTTAELNAYHRCEDCWVGGTPDTGGSPQRFHRHNPDGANGQRVHRPKTPY